MNETSATEKFCPGCGRSVVVTPGVTTATDGLGHWHWFCWQRDRGQDEISRLRSRLAEAEQKAETLGAALYDATEGISGTLLKDRLEAAERRVEKAEAACGGMWAALEKIARRVNGNEKIGSPISDANDRHFYRGYNTANDACRRIATATLSTATGADVSAVIEAARQLRDNSPIGNDDRPYISDVSAREFDTLMRALAKLDGKESGETS